MHPISTIDDLYEADYFRSYAEAGMPFPTELDTLPPRYIDRLEQLANGAAPRTLLEIGCGHGSFLNTARERGWSVQGLDLSRYAAEHVKARFGIDVKVGVLEHARFPDQAFDAVHMSHVLEHLMDPVSTLREVRRIMKPGARLGIEVPNELENAGTLLRGHFDGLQPYAVRSTHVYFFSPSTLRRVVETASLTVTSVRTLRDLRDARLWRRLAKTVVAAVEQPMHRGPLIELIAVR
jgi:2-polyprenyl-3-methyl-5-hydroxy-6-metoxy-1,4-benzoquinol methylase